MRALPLPFLVPLVVVVPAIASAIVCVASHGRIVTPHCLLRRSHVCMRVSLPVAGVKPSMRVDVPAAGRMVTAALSASIEEETTRLGTTQPASGTVKRARK